MQEAGQTPSHEWVQKRDARVPLRAYRNLTAGNYLTALHQLQHAYLSWERTPTVANFLLWALNSVDPWDTAWALSGKGNVAVLPDTSALIEPEGAIAAALSDHHVVILMEAHSKPETRYFGARLLHALRAAGATHLAFETSRQATLDQFAHSGRLRPNTAVYAFEPARAHLLRTARALGLRLFAFDYVPEGPLPAALNRFLRGRLSDAEAINRERELYMAHNIVQQLLKREPTARVVVWTGEQHAMKRTPLGWRWQHPFMAAHLARLTDEEPFCVWQECVDLPALSTGPKLLISAHPTLQERGVDALVLHHRGATPARPSWLDQGSLSVAIPTVGAELVQAIPEAEGDKAVPTAQWLTHQQRDQAQLPPGRYILRGLQGKDVIVWQRRLMLTPSADQPAWPQR